MASLKLKTSPAEDPVTVTEAKEYLRVDESLEDARILTMIRAVTSRIEYYIDQKIISQIWYQYFDRFPNTIGNDWWDGVREMAISELYSPQAFIEMQTGPLRSVVAFNTYADDGVPNVFDSSNYVIDNAGPYGRIALKLGGVWPTTILRKVIGIEIESDVGISPNAAGVPQDIRQAVLEYVALIYEHRGDEKIAMPNSVMSLLDPYKRFKGGMKVGY